MSKHWSDDEPQQGWTDWRPAHAATCRKGGCSAPAVEGFEWCARHHEDVSARRDATRAQDRLGDQERGIIKQPVSITRAFGKVVVTVHGDVDAKLLGRTLTVLAEEAERLRRAMTDLAEDLAEDQGNLHLIIDLRDAGVLDQDSVGVLVGSAQRVQEAGGELVLTAPSLAGPDALGQSGFTIAESGAGLFRSGPLFSPPRP
jgi:anti-anti-sigma regulatory factor